MTSDRDSRAFAALTRLLLVGAGVGAGWALGRRSTSPSQSDLLARSDAPPDVSLPMTTPPAVASRWMGRKQQVGRGLMSLLLLGGVIGLVIVILKQVDGNFDSIETAGIAYAAASLLPAYAVVRQYQHQAFFWLVFAAGFFPVIASLLIFVGQQFNGGVVTLTLGAAGLSLLAVILEAAGLGRTVWMWQEIPWPSKGAR